MAAVGRRITWREGPPRATSSKRRGGGLLLLPVGEGAEAETEIPLIICMDVSRTLRVGLVVAPVRLEEEEEEELEFIESEVRAGTLEEMLPRLMESEAEFKIERLAVRPRPPTVPLIGPPPSASPMPSATPPKPLPDTPAPLPAPQSQPNAPPFSLFKYEPSWEKELLPPPPIPEPTTPGAPLAI